MVLTLIPPDPFSTGLIIPTIVRKTFRPMLLIIAAFLVGYSDGIPGLVPGLGGLERCPFIVLVVVVLVG